MIGICFLIVKRLKLNHLGWFLVRVFFPACTVAPLSLEDNPRPKGDAGHCQKSDGGAELCVVSVRSLENSHNLLGAPTQAKQRVMALIQKRI